MFDYGEMTYEGLMRRCMDRVPSTVDKREGSVLYDALAPACAELAEFYTLLSTEMNRAFPDTAEDIDLTNKAKERGIFRLPATKAVRLGVFRDRDAPAAVPIGARFSGGDCNYRVVSPAGEGSYQMECEESGDAGNRYFGTLFPIDALPRLAAAQMIDVLIPGEEEESDNALRARYLRSLKNEAYGGNIADYKEKVSKLPGVGAVKVFPVWQGGGTVKLVLLDSENKPPAPELLDAVQTAVDPEPNHGEGLGIAPIGHTVTVTGAEAVPVTVTLIPTLDAALSWEDVKAPMEEAAAAYLAELTEGWEDGSRIIVRLSQMESRLLEIAGIVDVTDSALNGFGENLILSAEQVPVLEEVSENAAG